DAERDARGAIALRPNAALFENLAWAQFREGKFDDALENANRAVVLNRNSALAYAIRAAVEQVLGKRLAAVADIRRAADYDRSFETRRDRFEKGRLIFEPDE